MTFETCRSATVWWCQLLARQCAAALHNHTPLCTHLALLCKWGSGWLHNSVLYQPDADCPGCTKLLCGGRKSVGLEIKVSSSCCLLNALEHIQNSHWLALVSTIQHSFDVAQLLSGDVRLQAIQFCRCRPQPSRREWQLKPQGLGLAALLVPTARAASCWPASNGPQISSQQNQTRLGSHHSWCVLAEDYSD